MSKLAFVNDSYVQLDQARISPLDRGFLFADGVYEVTAVLEGGLVDSGFHLARLRRSCAEIRLPLPAPLERIEAVQRELIARNRLVQGLVYLQITRGVADRDFAFPPAGTRPTVFMYVQEKELSNPPQAQAGIAVCSVPDLRWRRRDIKSVGMLAQVLAKQAAKEAGCQEAWMVEDELVTEGASSTAFIITPTGVLVTRPESHAVLPGVTRLALLTLVKERGIKIDLRPFSVAEAQDASEAFITSAGSFVQSVVKVDGKPVGDGRPGAVSQRLRVLYLEHARQSARASKQTGTSGS